MDSRSLIAFSPTKRKNFLTTSNLFRHTESKKSGLNQIQIASKSSRNNEKGFPCEKIEDEYETFCKGLNYRSTNTFNSLNDKNKRKSFC